MRIPLTLSFLVSAACLAQSPDVSELRAFQPRSIGPASMSGRVTAIAVEHKNPNHIFIGTASGGLWKSTSGGLTWQPVFDTMGTGSIGAVAIQQNNPDVVWAGTGEGNPRNSHNSGIGIFKSLDGGRSWKNMGLKDSRTIHRILINPLNGNEVYVAVMGSIWGPGSERGVFKTTDGGLSWKKILFTNELSGCAELVMDPSNPDKIFASMWEYHRKPYTFNSGGKGSGMYMTVDGGKTWNKLGINEGLPAGIMGRAGIAIAPSNPNKVYALVESEKIGFYISEDGGYHWSKVTENPQIGNRPFYYSEIYADPGNEHHVISIWSQVTHSIDGGRNWQTLLDWNHIHPDHHAFYIHPDNPDLMMDGNDGGFNISYDGGENWRYVSNLPVGQFYHISVDDEIPYHIYGGLQDNGSWKGPGFNWRDGGLRNSDWQEVLFGDGFDVLSIPGYDNKGYAAWQGGNVYFYDLSSGKSQSVQPVHPKNEYLRYNWNAAIALHPANPNGLYYGSQYLHKSHNNGLSWSIISPDLTTNDTSKLHQAQSGGLTIDATNAENYCTIIAISPAKSDTNVIWVGTDDGNVQLTRDGGKTWSLLNSKIPDAPKNPWVPFIWVNPKDAGEAWVVMNNYRQNDWQPYLYMTNNYGKSWTRKADGNKVSGHCLSVLRDPVEPNLVWLGTDHGLWISFNGGNEWQKWEKGMPSCPVQDLALQERESDLVVGTFGRSIYVFDDIKPLRKLASGYKPNEGIHILSSGHGYLAEYQRPDGERFGADDFYEGQNKPSGVSVDLYTTGNKNKKSGKWESQKVTAEVWSGATKIRTWQVTFDSAGYYRIRWNMREDGYRFPSHGNPKNEEFLPPGLTVKPGKYKLVLRYKQVADSTEVDVREAPGNSFQANGEKIRREMNDRLKVSVSRAYKAFEALKDAEDIIKAVSDAKYEDDSAASRIGKLAKPLTDSINTLKLLFMQAKDQHYYEEITVRLNDKLYAASGYIQSNAIPAENAMAALLNAEQLTNQIVQRVNAFFEKEWNAFRAETEKEKMKLFTPMGGY